MDEWMDERMSEEEMNNGRVRLYTPSEMSGRPAADRTHSLPVDHPTFFQQS